MKTRLAIISMILALFLLAGCAVSATSPEVNDAAEDSIVSAEAVKLDENVAKAVALTDAGVTEGEVTDLRMEYEVDDGIPQYEVDFRVGDNEYDYTIHGETGEVLGKDQDHEPVKVQPTDPPATEAPPTEPPATEPPATEAPAKEITAEEAKAIALADAGLKESEVTGLKVELDKEDNEYDVDFRSGDYDYDYTVGAKTGDIREKDKEKETAKQTSSSEKTTTSTQNTSSNKSTTSSKNTSSSKSTSSDKITSSKAKSIALADAGVKESKTTGLRVEYDKSDNEYDVDFRSGDYEYDYTINAKTGKIRERDKEYDPVKKPAEETKPAATEPPATEAPKETEPPATEAPKETKPAEEKISASKAKSIALKHAGVSSSNAKGMECEYDVDDGVKVYDVSFRSGKYEYDYEINAITGKIISWDKEIDD